MASTTSNTSQTTPSSTSNTRGDARPLTAAWPDMIAEEHRDFWVFDLGVDLFGLVEQAEIVDHDSALFVLFQILHKIVSQYRIVFRRNVLTILYVVQHPVGRVVDGGLQRKVSVLARAQDT